MKSTTIRISEEVWKYLNKRKEINEDFDSILKRLLKLEEKEDE